MEKEIVKETLITCKNCEDTYMHITNVYNTLSLDLDYPPRSYGYRQGAIVVELTGECCEHKQYIVIGQHKGQVFLSIRENEDK